MGSLLFEATSPNINNQDPNRINETDTAYINSIFVNNGFSPIESQDQIIKEKTKRLKAYDSPIMIKRAECKLEKDPMEPSFYYISFKYTSLHPFKCNIYLNATDLSSSSIIEDSSYISSEAFNEKVIHINNVPSGTNEIFLEKEARFDMSFFQDNKIFDKDYHDLIIECVIYKKDNSHVECILSTMLKILKVKGSYIIKPDCQKLKVRNIWFDMTDVFGLQDNPSANAECEACYTNKKNTVFLPCMHSYACSECSVNVRLRGNKCPLCREKITDTLLIEDRNEKKV